jgi:excisionase family DNA binding protein
MKRPTLCDLKSHTFPWVTPPELAGYLKCDPRTILRMIEAGTLYAYRVGRNWRIPTEEARQSFHGQHTSQRTA